MSRIISIHQPYYFPWLGYFEKIAKSDIFVILDDVQYEKNNFYNRNKIKSSTGWDWLSVPVHNKNRMKITDIRIANSMNWQEKHFRQIYYNYNKSEFYPNYNKMLEYIFKDNRWEKLIDLNMFIIKEIMKNLKIKTKLIFSSECNVTGSSTKKLVNLCKYLNADIYYSGISGHKYLDMKLFSENGIEVIFQNYTTPNYSQLHNDFIPDLSIIDLLLNNGPKSKAILLG